MEKQLALIADSANISVEGKLNILGEFDTLFTDGVPVVHPSLWFVAKLLVEVADAGSHRLMLRVVDDDGNTVLPPLTGVLKVPVPDAGYSGERRPFPVVLQVRNATFPRLGRYTFELRFDELIVADVPLHVALRQGLTPAG